MPKSRAVARVRRVDPIQSALVRLAEAQEETQAELRQLAHRTGELAEAQRRTEDRAGRLEAAVEQLAEAQRRTEDRVGRLEAAVEQLAEAQRRTEARLEELAKDVQILTRSVQHLNGRVGNIEGRLLEDRYRADPFSFFQTILTRMRVVAKQELDARASDFIDRGALTHHEREDLLRADVVVYGRPKDAAAYTYLVAEVSATISPHDVGRAMRRAELLSRLTGEPAVPAVAGAAIHPDAAAVGQSIWRVLDGIAVAPGQPVPESLTGQS